MKKTQIVVLINLFSAAVIYGSAMANELSNYYQASNNSVRFFIETGATLFSESKVKIKYNDITLSEIKTSSVNSTGALGFGIDIQGIQLSVTPQYLKAEDTDSLGVQLNATVPILFNSAFTPFLFVSGGYFKISNDSLGFKIKESTFAYSVGAGVRYWLDGNIFITGSCEFTKMTFDNVADTDGTMQITSWGISTSLGYRF